MYIQEGKHVSVEDIQNGIVCFLSKDWYKDVRKKTNDNEIEMLAECLFGLNEALLNKRSVWADCVKEPRGNLDTGRHHYDVYYNNADGQRCMVYNRLLIRLRIMEKMKGSNDWTFQSGAIGMSRKLDATEGLFRLLKEVTGTYGQL